MKDHTAEIERNGKVVVPKRIVLFRVQHFQKRGAGIAMSAAAPKLVDLIKHHDAVSCSGFRSA